MMHPGGRTNSKTQMTTLGLQFSRLLAFSEFFNVLNVNYNLRGASKRLMLPSFNLEYMHKSWSYLTTKLWNSLPTRVRECRDLSAFRRALLSFMARR